MKTRMRKLFLTLSFLGTWALTPLFAGAQVPGGGAAQPGGGAGQPGKGAGQPGKGVGQPAQPGPGGAQPGKGVGQPGAGGAQPGTGGQPTPRPSGTIPANPNQGTGQPATPATPGNPKAKENTIDTPSRTGETPSRKNDQSDKPLKDQKFEALPKGTGTGTGTQPGSGAAKPNTGASKDDPQPAGGGATQPGSGTSGSGTTQPGSGTSGGNTGAGGTQQPAGGNTGAGSPGTTNDVTQANVSGDNLLKGLVNLNVSNVNVQASDLINISNSLNNTQVQAVVQALNTNPQASTNARMLTERLRERGVLQQGQRVLGFQDGKVYVSGNVSGGTSK